MYLLDTNVLSELIRKRPDSGVVAKAELLDQQDCFASEVTLFELRYGAMLRDDAKAFWATIPAISSSEKPAARPSAMRASCSRTWGANRRRRPRLPIECIKPLLS